MKMNKNVMGLAVAVVGLTAVSQAPAVFAQSETNNRSERSPIAVASVAISEVMAVATAEGKLAGTVKKTHLDRYHGKVTWKIRILSTDGLTRGDFRIDGTTGLIVQSKIRQIGKNHLSQTTRLSMKIEREKSHLLEKQHKFEMKMESKGHSSN